MQSGEGAHSLALHPFHHARLPRFLLATSPPKQPHGAAQLQQIAQRLYIGYIYIIPVLRVLSKQKETFSALVSLALVAEGALIRLRDRKGHRANLESSNVLCGTMWVGLPSSWVSKPDGGGCSPAQKPSFQLRLQTSGPEAD